MLYGMWTLCEPEEFADFPLHSLRVGWRNISKLCSFTSTSHAHNIIYYPVFFFNTRTQWHNERGVGTTVSSTIDLREKSRFRPFCYSHSKPLREVRCFRKTPYFSWRLTVGIAERSKSRFLPQINRTGNCSMVQNSRESNLNHALLVEQKLLTHINKNILGR